MSAKLHSRIATGGDLYSRALPRSPRPGRPESERLRPGQRPTEAPLPRAVPAGTHRRCLLPQPGCVPRQLLLPTTAATNPGPILLLPLPAPATTLSKETCHPGGDFAEPIYFTCISNLSFTCQCLTYRHKRSQSEIVMFCWPLEGCLPSASFRWSQWLQAPFSIAPAPTPNRSSFFGYPSDSVGQLCFALPGYVRLADGTVREERESGDWGHKGCGA